MMASTSELLSLECKPHSYSVHIKSFAHHNASDQQPTQKLEEYLNLLEEERLKIDAFKRELPLCLQLLTNEMEASRQQLQSHKTNQGTRPVLEEFIPLKHSNCSEASEQKPANFSDKANWMTSAQLWSQAGDGKHQNASTFPKTEAGVGFSVSPKQTSDSNNKQWNNGGAFLPFTKDRSSIVPNDQSIPSSLPDLALTSGEGKMEDNRCTESTENGKNGSRAENNSVKRENGVVGKAVDSQTTTTAATTTTTQTTNRKARRCWSPDLHRRFVNALQMLGGSQVATPKQIRELMKVDGLTNDEVKSHLQKYRLHTRRPGPSPQATGGPAPQLVVLGGIWVPPEYATAAAAATHGGAPTIYSTHPTSQVTPPNFCSPAVPQDFYPPPPGHPQLHHLALHHHHNNHQQQLHVYNTPTQMHSSPESDHDMGAGDHHHQQSESIEEDGKSDSSSWRAENGGERKKLAALRDDGEESNGSEIITLKF